MGNIYPPPSSRSTIADNVPLYELRRINTNKSEFIYIVSDIYWLIAGNKENWCGVNYSGCQASQRTFSIIDIIDRLDEGWQ